MFSRCNFVPYFGNINFGADFQQVTELAEVIPAWTFDQFAYGILKYLELLSRDSNVEMSGKCSVVGNLNY